jgi:hypothetical protein
MKEETCIVCGAVIPEGRQVCLNCEDKIKQGKLIDTEAYFIVKEDQWAGKNRFLVCQNAVQLAVCDFCETEEEAEAVLKELEEKGR